MEIVFKRCAGLDVHKKSVVACALTPEGKEVKSFSTLTAELYKLADWLQSHGVVDLAMESTGVYWQPVHNVLEDRGLRPIVVNAQHIKAVPGRKTDVKDAEWIAECMQVGLLRGSYIPERPQRELRELVRHRRSLVQERSQTVNRIEKLLEGANIKLSSMISDLTGVTGRAILEALANGSMDPEFLAQLRKGNLRASREELAASLQGVMRDHQRFLLRSLLRQLTFLEEEIAALDGEVAQRTAPFEELLQRLDAIPGIGRRGAEDILAEIGFKLDAFPSARHLASWARLCPGSHESAGKRKQVGTGHANRWLRAALTQAAQAAARKKESYFQVLYHRLAARRGKKRAVLALAHAILVVIYHMVTTGRTYTDLGPYHFDLRDQQRLKHRLVHRLEGLGYKVSLEAA
jgi:transposase